MSKQSTNFVIAISGTPGSGKTTLVREVVERLGNAVAIHFDDYKSVAEYPADMANPGGLTRWIEQGKDLNAWKIPQMLTDLKALRTGHTITLPDSQTNIEPAKYIVLEEPSGRAREGLQDLVDMVVLIDLPLDVALARRTVEYVTYCIENLTNGQLEKALTRFVDGYSRYHLLREYFLTVREGADIDCDLIVNGFDAPAEMAMKVVDAVKENIFDPD